MQPPPNTTNCVKCGRDNAGQAKFCSYCGEQLAAPCPACGGINPPDGLFCQNCGRKLAAGQGPPGSVPAGTASTPLTGADCPRCGTVNEPASAYCYQCGLPLEDDLAQRAPSATTIPVSQPPVDFRVPLPRILIMMVLSLGLYFFYWICLTWKHYRDSTGEEAYPVWHTLTLFVPIYGLFRVHAHMRTYKELMTGEGMSTTISPGWAVVAVLVMWLFWILGYLIAGTWLLLHVQGNLNQLWSYAYDRVDSTGFSVVELALVIVGIFFWTTILLAFVP